MVRLRPPLEIVVLGTYRLTLPLDLRWQSPRAPSELLRPPSGGRRTSEQALVEIVDAVESPRILKGYVITPLWPLPVVVVPPDMVFPVPLPPYPPSLCDDKLYSAEIVSVEELDRSRCSCRPRRLLPDELFIVLVEEEFVIVCASPEEDKLCCCSFCCTANCWAFGDDASWPPGVSGDEVVDCIVPEDVDPRVASICVCSVDTEVELEDASDRCLQLSLLSSSFSTLASVGSPPLPPPPAPFCMFLSLGVFVLELVVAAVCGVASSSIESSLTNRTTDDEMDEFTT